MANPEYISELKKLIQRSEHCEAEYAETVPVHEQFQGQTVWRGEVEVFDLKKHAKAVRCYAWATFRGTQEYEKFHIVLQLPPILTPTDAVRAAIYSESNEAGLEVGRIYKATCFALKHGKNILIQCDLIVEDGGKTFIVLEWWPDLGLGEAPKTKIQIDPKLLQKMRDEGFFYRGQISIPQSQGN